MKPVEVVMFPKACPHGVPMRVVRKLSGAWWYETDRCAACMEKKDTWEEAAHAAYFAKRTK